ncbi:MAG TPA: hypothetical protein PKC49_08650 [Phycisphaerae bacterium]|nr:hypothetical protein [Phycisphaerae bacterium]
MDYLRQFADAGCAVLVRYFRQEPDRGPPDALSLGRTLDDRVLKDILVRLYYPESPYEFSVLSADVLGQV